MQRLDELEAQASEAWHRSKGVAVTELVEVTESGTDDGKAVHRTTKRHQCGDPRFLAEMRRCVEARCRMLGLFAKDNATAAEPTDTQAGPAELRKIFAELTTAELEVLSGPFRRYREQLTRRFPGLN